jgi:putative nucleotidyltransferase with HDIG domain
MMSLIQEARFEQPTVGYSAERLETRPERFLIVDDEPLIRDLLARVVSDMGFASDTAQNGKQAQWCLAKTEYQMVLSDITMPVLDGLSLLSYVTTHHPETAMIMITGATDLNSAVHALSTGAYDYVTKPFNAVELNNKIEKALERRRLVLENKSYQLHLERRVQQQTGELREALGKINAAYGHTLEALIHALDARERETQRHSKRVSDYTMVIARRLDIPSAELSDLERGSLLHDIGKIGISDTILLKPAKLNQDEWIEIRKHPDIGFQILNGISFLEGAAEMVRQHHERFDGTGYPRGLKRDEILLAARIFAVVDTFDAMTSDRPYRKALSYHSAREEILRCSGSQFDPELVSCFLQIPEETWFESKESLRA